MTFIYTLEDVIALIALGVGIVGLLLIVIFARISNKMAKRHKKREERMKKKCKKR